MQRGLIVGGLLLASLAGGLASCGRGTSASQANETTAVGHSGRSDLAAGTISSDSTGEAPPQPSPYGGDTPVGAAGDAGSSPSSRNAVETPPPTTR